MIWRKAAGALVTFLLAASSASALDFTLSTRMVDEDGFPREVSSFAYDATTSVAIQVPPKWRILTTPATITMVSPSIASGEVEIEKSPFAASVPFKEPDLARYHEYALAQVPAGSTEVHLKEEKEEPLPIFDWIDREYVLEYVLYNVNYKRSILFVNMDAATQMRVMATALPDNFDQVHKAAYKLLQSWRPLTAPASPPPPR